MSQSPVSSVGTCPAFTPPTVDGFHGVWYGYTDGTYYAGGLGTFPQQIHPMAYHAAKTGERGRTFFVYGGARAGVPGNHTFAHQPVHAHDDQGGGARMSALVGQCAGGEWLLLKKMQPCREALDRCRAGPPRQALGLELVETAWSGLDRDDGSVGTTGVTKVTPYSAIPHWRARIGRAQAR